MKAFWTDSTQRGSLRNVKYPRSTAGPTLTDPRRQVHWRFTGDLGQQALSHGPFRLASVAGSQLCQRYNNLIRVFSVCTHLNQSHQWNISRLAKL